MISSDRRLHALRCERSHHVVTRLVVRGMGAVTGARGQIPAGPLTGGPCPVKTILFKISKLHSNLQIQKGSLPCSKNIQILHGDRFEDYDQLSLLGGLQILN
jgi:hypothetical protein